MQFRTACIESLATVYPPDEVTSAEIEARLAPVYERLRLPQGRLELMTGIRARRFWPHPIRPSEAAAEAGRAVLEKTSVPPEEIDLLLHCGVCRDRLEPATAAYVHGLLGLRPSVQIADVSNACLGFLNGIVLAGSMVEAGVIRSALLVSGENGRPLLARTLQTLAGPEITRKTFKPYFANLTIGAGAVAAVVTSTTRLKSAQPHVELKAGVVRTDSSANALCEGDASGADGLEMMTEAEALLEAGIRLAGETWRDLRVATGWGADDYDRVVCHQVGRAHQRQLLEALAVDPAKDFVTYPEMGNVGSVSLPFTLAEAIAQGAVKPGQRVALLGIGSGLSSLMMGVRYVA